MTLASLFYKFHRARASEHIGVGDHYRDRLKPRRKMLAIGLTATPETADPLRSDTHACSAHPAHDLLTIIAGIQPGSGFHDRTQRTESWQLEWVEASMPHPKAMISTGNHSTDFGAHASVTLPKSVSGTRYGRESLCRFAQANKASNYDADPLD